MSKRAMWQGAQGEFIRTNAAEFTAKQIAEALGISETSAYITAKKLGVEFKKPPFVRVVKPKPVIEKRERPRAVYNTIPSPYGVASEMRIL